MICLDKKYENDEDDKRMNRLLANKVSAQRHNDAYERGETSFRHGINHLTDRINRNLYEKKQPILHV